MNLKKRLIKWLDPHAYDIKVVYERTYIPTPKYSMLESNQKLVVDAVSKLITLASTEFLTKIDVTYETGLYDGNKHLISQIQEGD